jgi:hypothetical protein
MFLMASDMIAVYSNHRKIKEFAMSLDFDIWGNRLFTSISNLSRTSRGSANKAYQGKPDLLIADPVQLQKQTAQNLRHAILCVWTRGLFVKTQATHVRSFIDALSSRTSEGLLPADRQLRTWELDKSKYPEGILPDMIARAHDDFCNEITLMMNDGVDSVRDAAWIERVYDAELHPLADGCGRVAKLLGAWILLRDGKYPAYFENRQEYYAAMGSSWDAWEGFYQARVLS